MLSMYRTVHEQSPASEGKITSGVNRITMGAISYGPGAESSYDTSWAVDQIQVAERNQDIYRESREIHSKSWHWMDIVSTFVPVAIAVLFLLLMLFWVIRLFVL